MKTSTNSKNKNPSPIICCCGDTDLISKQIQEPLFRSKLTTNRVLNKKYAEVFFNFFNSTTKLFIPIPVHVVTLNGQPSGAVADKDYINELFYKANEIWSQACIELSPYYTGIYITTFQDLAITAFAGLCLSPSDLDLVKPYEVVIPYSPQKIINLFLVEDTNGLACGSPYSAHVILPTYPNVTFTGRVFAHEIGHILLNPVGVDDSPNPDHLMFHEYAHPDIPPGTKRELFLSDCLGARMTAKENIYSFARSTGFQDIISCEMNPQLGNDMFIGKLNSSE